MKVLALINNHEKSRNYNLASFPKIDFQMPLSLYTWCDPFQISTSYYYCSAKTEIGNAIPSLQHPKLSMTIVQIILTRIMIN
jgi:hypothetical protein